MTPAVLSSFPANKTTSKPLTLICSGSLCTAWRLSSCGCIESALEHHYHWIWSTVWACSMVSAPRHLSAPARPRPEWPTLLTWQCSGSCTERHFFLHFFVCLEMCLLHIVGDPALHLQVRKSFFITVEVFYGSIVIFTFWPRRQLTD